jgi:hypothetical protein
MFSCKMPRNFHGAMVGEASTYGFALMSSQMRYLSFLDR